MKLMTTASLIAAAVLVGVASLDAQGRSNGVGRSNGTARGNAPGTPPGQARNVHQVAEPATLTLLGLALGGGLVARGWHARRRRA